ncbi:MAG TPA: hypothetical protein VFU15_04795 [Bacteroidia bacterium]|nr:hypothetical protein [Bacteroidia bacterium]
MSFAPVSLEQLTDEEKEKIVGFGKKEVFRGLWLYFIPALIIGYAVVYINGHYMGLGLEDPTERSVINLALVILAVVPIRLFINSIVRLKNAHNAWQKKIIRGKITSREGKFIVISGQKIIPGSFAGQFSGEGFYIVTMSTVGNYILSVEKKEEAP